MILANSTFATHSTKSFWWITETLLLYNNGINVKNLTEEYLTPQHMISKDLTEALKTQHFLPHRQPWKLHGKKLVTIWNNNVLPKSWIQPRERCHEHDLVKTWKILTLLDCFMIELIPKFVLGKKLLVLFHLKSKLVLLGPLSLFKYNPNII